VKRTNADRLRDILRAITAIDRAEAVRRRHAEDSELPDVVLAAIQFHVFTIGEAVKALPSELTDRHSDVPWSDVVRMRDLIGHHYYRLDAEIVRATIGEPLARLRAACEALVSEDAGRSTRSG
jgi:uncharacterized protein with HEPN domain